MSSMLKWVSRLVKCSGLTASNVYIGDRAHSESNDPENTNCAHAVSLDEIWRMTSVKMK